MMPKTSLTITNFLKVLAAGSTIHAAKQVLACVLAFALILPMLPQTLSAAQEQDQNAPAPAQDQDAQTPAQPSQAPPYTQQTADQLQQLVAPDRWVQANPDLKGDALAKAVDQQSWDPSVKALTAFPTVLGNMDKNI